MGRPSQEQCDGIFLLGARHHHNCQIIESTLPAQLCELGPIAMRLRFNMVTGNHLFNDDRNRMTEVLLQALCQASQRFFRQIRSRTRICGIRYDDQPGLQRPLIDLCERIGASRPLCRHIVADPRRRNGGRTGYDE